MLIKYRNRSRHRCLSDGKTQSIEYVGFYDKELLTERPQETCLITRHQDSDLFGAWNLGKALRDRQTSVTGVCD